MSQKFLELEPLEILKYADYMEEVFQRKTFTINYQDPKPLVYNFGKLNYVDSTQADRDEKHIRKTSCSVSLRDPLFHEDAAIMQSYGYSVFFLVQDSNTDPATDTNHNIISAKNIDPELRFVTWDTDGVPYKPFYKALRKAGFPPHYWIESSHEKRHAVIRLSHTITELQLKAFQEALFAKFKGDKSLNKTSQQLRLLGSYHLKDRNNPTLVTPVKILPNAPEPTLEDLIQILELKLDISNLHKKEALPELTSDTKFTEGERHGAIFSYTMQQAALGHTREELHTYTTGFIYKHVANSEEFLPGGKRAHEIIRIIDTCLDYVKKEEHTRLIQVLDNEPQKQTKHPLALPDSIFASIPGIAGEITSHILTTAVRPLPPMAFLASLALLSTIKGNIFKTPTALRSNIYAAVIADSGGGKNYPMNVVTENLEALNIGHRYCSSIRSAAGLKRHISDTAGNLSFIKDEIGHWFERQQSNKLPVHEAEVVDLLLRLYSLGNGTLREGKLADESKEQVLVKDPSFGIFGATTPDKLDASFTLENIREGLFSRWTITVCENWVDALSSSYPTTHLLPEELLTVLSSLNHANLELEEVARQTSPLRIELDELESINKLKTVETKRLKAEGYKKAAIQEYLEDHSLILTQEQHERASILGKQIASLSLDASKTAQTKIVVPFLPEAQRLFEDYFWELETKIERLTKEGNPIKAVYTRAREQAYKHALAICSNESGITKEEASWAIDYSRLMADGMFKFASEKIGISKEYKLSEDILTTIKSLYRDLEDPTEGISKDSLRYRTRDIESNIRNPILKELESLGKIQLKKVKKEGQRGPTSERIFLLKS